MLQARKDWPEDASSADVIAFPAQLGTKGDFGRRKAGRPWNLVVDLHAEPIGLKWAQGAAMLAALCSSAVFLMPDFNPGSFVPPAKTPAIIHNATLSDLAMPEAPVEDPSTSLPKPVGMQTGNRGDIERISGDVSEGLYFSLRAAGASPSVATDFIKAVATRIDVAEIAPFDRFDFAVRKGTTGQPDQLIYAGLNRVQYDDVRLLKWDSGGKADWFDGSPARQVSSGLMAPVAGRITSGFGYRYHPILHFSRMHAGIDFGAPWGTPIVAAADGQVVGAGWSGGYGRQVRIAHGSGLMTTYSHMSQIIADPGLLVRQGQVIGYVGTSGLATGPHLHFEVRIHGAPVNPLTARLASRAPAVDAKQLAAFKARLKELTSIPMKPKADAPPA